jgi:chromosome segregation ATPase
MSKKSKIAALNAKLDLLDEQVTQAWRDRIHHDGEVFELREKLAKAKARVKQAEKRYRKASALEDKLYAKQDRLTMKLADLEV